jgi:hypothetical protein
MDKQRSTKHYTENVRSSNLHIDLFYDNNDISLPENDGQCIIPVKHISDHSVRWHYHLQWICGYVHVYRIIKQLDHACSGNSQNYCPSVLEMTWELLPSYYSIYMHITTNPLKMIMSTNWMVTDVLDRNDALPIVLGHGTVRIRK